MKFYQGRSQTFIAREAVGRLETLFSKGQNDNWPVGGWGGIAAIAQV